MAAVAVAAAAAASATTTTLRLLDPRHGNSSRGIGRTRLHSPPDASLLGKPLLAAAKPCKSVMASRSSRSLLLVRSAATPDSSSASKPSSSGKTSKKAPGSLREKALNMVEQQSGYFWLLGPLVATSSVLVPGMVFSLPELLQNNLWLGLGWAFGMDIIFVLAADAFFVLSDKTGRHQTLPGGSPPWIGPWELTGYPKGLPFVWDYICYAGVGVAALGLVVSLLLGKLGTALAAFGPYLALIFIQSAYEHLLCNDRLPTFPLVPIVYTLYRFRQLARAMEVFAVFDGGFFMAGTVRLLIGLWTLYLAAYLSQLPWLYSSWNSNRAT